ncbi:MAG: hypothetical protein JW841_13215 [Deltaproteobacteria bacterium]|nr:hypothetical protein [Deltaproteobacteria bacterium]
MQRYKLVFGFALSILTTCAETETEEAANTCSHDYDCAVNYVCDHNTDPAVCKKVDATTIRTFGEVDLDFTDEDAVYLLSVVAIPDGAEAISSSYIPFSLKGAGGDQSALKISPLSSPINSKLSPAMYKRFALDKMRHARTMQIARNYVSGVYTAPKKASVSSCSEDCGTDKMCWKGECTAAPHVNFLNANTPITCSLAEVVTAGKTKINVVVDSALTTGQQSDAVAAVKEFAKTLTNELSLLGRANGHVDPLDRDGDGRFTVVFTNRTTSTVTMDMVGFFNPDDFLDAELDDATGNAADILWARATDEITPELIAGTLTHEYQHLVNFAVRVQGRGDKAQPEALWLDEGLAHLMEDLNGWGASNIGTVALALSGWNAGSLALSGSLLKTANADQQQRGKAFLLLRHLRDRRGSNSFIADLLNEDAAGLEHNMFAKGAIVQMLQQLQLAVYATGNEDISLDTAHAYDFAKTSTSSDTSQKMGINTHDTYTDARGEDVTLEGPEDIIEVDVSDDTESLTSAEIIPSGTLLFLVTGGTEAINLQGTATADADLHVSVTRVQ